MLKVSCPAVNLRPVALTSVVMKCFEKMLKTDVNSSLDPLLFAYRQGRSTEAAVATLMHLIYKHARVLFGDFSLAFNTVQPQLLIQKLTDFHVKPFIIQWFYPFF